MKNRQYAVASLFAGITVLLFGTVICSATGVDEHLALLLGGIAGLVLYKLKYPLDFSEQLRSFDMTVPIMMLILNFTACELSASLFGLIASRFMTVTHHAAAVSEITPMAVIGSVIFAPVGEELLFRLCGVGLMKRSFGRLFAVLFPTAVFSVMHFANPQNLVNVFAGAVVLALCYYYTENIIYTVIVHILHNALCLPDASVLYNNVNGFEILTLPFAAIGTVLFTAGMVWYIMVFRKKYADGKGSAVNR